MGVSNPFDREKVFERPQTFEKRIAWRSKHAPNFLRQRAGFARVDYESFDVPAALSSPHVAGYAIA